MKLNLTISSKDKRLQKYVSRLIENSTTLSILIDKIFLLCGIRSFANPIPVYLIRKKTNQEVFAWFSWTPQKSFITIEFNKSNKINNQFLLLILAHELFHLILRKNKKLIQKITEYAKSNKSTLQTIKENQLLPRIVLEELIISSFIPEGCLSKKTFRKYIKTISEFLYNDLIDWRRYIAYKMRTNAQAHVKSKKTIDDKYIKKIIELIKK